MSAAEGKAHCRWEGRGTPCPSEFLSPGFCRSWDLNKICYKSGVPLIENGMIERVSFVSLEEVEPSRIVEGLGGAREVNMGAGRHLLRAHKGTQN